MRAHLPLFLVLLSRAAAPEPLVRACEPIKIELCAGLGYNATSMPNLGGNELQQEADYTLKSFSPLIQYGCSAQLKLFLCSVYVPMCTEKVVVPIGPCRGLCESVRSRCFPVLRGFGFPWPDALNCSRFPKENNHRHMCMEGWGDRGVDVTAPVPTAPLDPHVHKFQWANGRNDRQGQDGEGEAPCHQPSLFDEAEKKFAELKLFLCSVYVPMCTEKVVVPIGPCRGLCESVRSRCFPVLRGFGFPWPDALNCSRFPKENNHRHMCMEGWGDRGVDVTAPVPTAPLDPHVHKFQWANGRNDRQGQDGEGEAPCHQPSLFDEAEKKFAEVWVTVWALICFVTSTGSALTLAVGGGRVRAGPLVSLSLCYCLVSVGWILRVCSGRISTCSDLNLPVGGETPDDGLSNVRCAFVFLLIYYFGMAANAWWVCLCGWWLARVGLCCGPEKMRGLGSALHVCAWGLPAVQTVAALVIRDVDSDQLTGTCYIGNRSTTTLLALVLLPNVVYLTLGVALLVLGCAYVVRRPRGAPGTQAAAAAPLTAPAPRKEGDFLGAVCTVCAVPLLCVVASVYYQYANRDGWLRGEARPRLWVFLLQHLMSFFVGGSSVFWVCSLKSVAAWRTALRRMGPRKQLPAKVQTMSVFRYGTAPTIVSSFGPANSARHSTRSHPHRKPRVHHVRNGGETVI